MIAPRDFTELPTLPLDNEHVANRLEETAELLEAQDANPYRVRAYRQAAQTLRQLDRPAHAIVADGGEEALTHLPTIGKALARAVAQLLHAGTFELLDELRGQLTPDRLLASIPGFGPELARRVHERLGITSLRDLFDAAHDGRLDTVPGMGPRRVRAVRETLAGRFGRRPGLGRLGAPPADPTPVDELLAIDREYRTKVEAGKLHRLAPRRLNPTGAAWLPVLYTRRGERRYTALFSNTALAHEAGATQDWVVIYREDRGASGRWTVVTKHTGPLRGLRVVRGREKECADYYVQHPAEAETQLALEFGPEPFSRSPAASADGPSHADTR
jgi:hypothetical protein